MKHLVFDMPCVFRLVYGANNNNPVITLFDSEEDALTYYESDDIFSYFKNGGYNDGYIVPGVCVDIEDKEFERIEIRHMSHEQLQEHLKRSEWYWYESVCEKYPTDEEIYERWHSMMEDKGWISVYEACMDHGDPMDDDPEEQLARWCLNNNIQRNDFEAKKYAEYQKDECVYYGHNECHADDESYLTFVENTLNLSDEHTYNDFMYTHFN